MRNNLIRSGSRVLRRKAGATSRRHAPASVQRWACCAVVLAALVLVPHARADQEKSGVRPNVIDLPKGPGSISGLGEQFEPSLQTGSASYSVKLIVPPGTAGFAPSLSLAYDSGRGNGPLGIGWSLDVGSIQRQTDRGVPVYDSSDRFLFNGQELVPLGGGIYRFKNEGAFTRFRRTSTSWEADGRDGSIYRFGVSSGARVEGAPGTFRWALESISDVWGNHIQFMYERDRGQLYLSRIEYNARPGAAENVVTFVYGARSDALTDYRAGFGVTTGKRLERVRMTSLGRQVRRYELTYEADTALSRLSTVTMYGTDDSSALPSLSLTYTDFEPGKHEVQDVGGAPAFSLLDGNTELADFDGDSLPDLLNLRTGAHAVAYNRGGSWSNATPLPSSPSVELASNGVEVADVDGNGLVDLVAKLSSGANDFYYFPNAGRGGWEARVAFTEAPPFSFEDANVRPIDFDGDGLTDVMQTASPGQYYFWRNGGDGTWGSPIAREGIGGHDIVLSDPQVKLADMNGDRLVDLVLLRNQMLLYWANMGHGHWAPMVRVEGAPDVGADIGRLQLADLNGDGLPDLFVARGTRLEMWLQQGDGSLGLPVIVTGLPEANASTTVVRAADMNGSGTTDIVWNAPSSPNPWRYLDLVGGVRPNLLSTIRNGLGREIRLTYGSSGALFQASREADDPWSTRLPIATQVVSEVATRDGRGWQAVQRLEYRNGYYDGPTRQFRGFGRTLQTLLGDEREATALTIHDFDVGATDEALKGTPLGIEVRNQKGVSLRRERFHHVVRSYATGTDGRRVAAAEKRLHEVDLVEGSSAPITMREEWTYDAYGNVLTHAEWGIVEAGDPLAGADERITTRQYANDPIRWLLGRETVVRVLNAKTERLSESRTYYDGPPFVGLAHGALGARGIVTRVEDWVAEDRYVQRKRVQYDEFGLVVVDVNPLGIRREIAHDPATHRWPISERLVLAEDRILSMSAAYDDAQGTLRTFRDVAGQVTSFRHDPLLRVTAILRPGDTEAEPGLSFEYVLGDPVSRVITRSRVGAGPVLEQHAFHDGLGRKFAAISTAENGATLVSDYVLHGPRGQEVSKFDAFFAQGFELPPVPTSPRTAYFYDALARREATVHQDGSRSQTRFSPLRTEFWNAHDLDPESIHFGTPLVQVTTGTGISEVHERLGEKTLITKYGRDGLGRVTSVTDARGSVTLQQVDGVGRLVEVEHPSSGRTRFTRDDAGNVLVRLDARGAKVVSTFDGASRLLTEQLFDSAGREEAHVRFHHDDPAPRFAEDALGAGRLTWVEDGAGEVHYRYDERGRLLESIRVLDGRPYRLAFEYDKLDRLISQHYPSGREIEFQRNERGLVHAIPGVVDASEYDARGLLTRRQLANGAVSLAAYDPMGRVRSLGVELQGSRLQQLDYDYDPLGNMLSIEDRVHTSGVLSGSRSFAYDGLYRLTAAKAPEQEWAFSFDEVGNLLFKSGVGDYAYGSPNQAVEIGGEVYRHDPAGHLVERPGFLQTFDAKGRLTTVAKDGGPTVRYRHAHDGRRVLKESEGPQGKTRVLYLEGIAEERGGIWVDYVQIEGRRIARLGGSPPGPMLVSHSGGLPAGALGFGGLALLAVAALLPAVQLRSRVVRLFAGAGLAALVGSCSCGGPVAGIVYYHLDHLGGVALQTDDRGAVIAESAYSPFGDLLASSSEPYGFTGKEWEAETGLYDFHARAYDPISGRFLSPDPAAFKDPEMGLSDPQTLNPYSYSRNSPSTFIDPSGRCSAPSNLKAGQVGLCVEAFISSARIPATTRLDPAQIGLGDDRTFAANDESKTARIGIQLTIDFQRNSVAVVGRTTGKSEMLFKDFGLQGTQKDRISHAYLHPDGRRTFTLEMAGLNGFHWAPGGPKDAIDIKVNFSISPDGKVSLAPGGQHDAYPSYGIYTYTTEKDGAVKSETTYEFKETTIDKLAPPMDIDISPPAGTP